MYKDEVKQAIFEAFEYIKARNELKEFIKDELLKAINGKWITLKPNGDKSKGTPIYIEDDESVKEAIKNLREKRNSHKQAITDLKYEKQSMKDMYSISKGKKGFKSTLADPISYEAETKNRDFNRLLQDMKNYLKTDITDVSQDIIDRFKNRVEKTIIEIDGYSDAEEKWTKFWQAIDNMTSYASINLRLKNKDY